MENIALEALARKTNLTYAEEAVYLMYKNAVMLDLPVLNMVCGYTDGAGKIREIINLLRSFDIAEITFSVKTSYWGTAIKNLCAAGCTIAGPVTVKNKIADDEWSVEEHGVLIKL